MGSYWKNKNLQKKWIPLKRRLRLNSRQRSILIGSLLGDGTLRLGEKAINVNFKIEHGLRQKEYLWWKYQIFKEWVFTEPKLSCRYKENREKYLKSWWFRTIRHPILTKYWQEFYKEGKKIIPESIEKYLDRLALAVWIMDDGSYSRKAIDISTYSFCLEDIKKLQDALERNFGLISKVYRDRDKGYRLYFSVSVTKILINIVRPLIIPPMSYKVGFPINPVTTDSVRQLADEMR